MPEPTRQEIINAHDALSEITYLADTYLSSISGELDETRELRQTILAALPPKPQPTMADVEWDDEKHQLAGVATSDGTEEVMLWHDEELGHIITEKSEWPRERLTPNGKRYKLVEVTDEPEHPEVLTTAGDYEKAPAGTIVAEIGVYPYAKRGLGDWADRFGEKLSNEGMYGTSRKLLRWGWGE